MNYRQTLQAVDTLRGLAVLGIEGSSNGSYIASPCPKCHEKAVFKAYPYLPTGRQPGELPEVPPGITKTPFLPHWQRGGFSFGR